MRIAGIIAEYDPFHRGHEYHIAETRRLSGCDYVVICMAGNFTQRGDAARLDKWSRARAALNCGADAVFELPCAWTVRSADAFARGGVVILSGLGCDTLSFGSEVADMALLRRLAELGDDEPEALSEAIRAGLAEGKSHARARGEALDEWLGLSPGALFAPNLILAVEYLRAIRALGSSLEPLAIPRLGAYHGGGSRSANMRSGAVPENSGGAWGFASASDIRAALERGEIEVACAEVPEAAQGILSSAPSMHAPDDLLLHLLRSMNPVELAKLPDVNEGLECRLARCAGLASSREELIDMLKCKRYTYARLSRLCAHALLGVTAEFLAAHPLPTYARLLGIREDARPLLAELSRRTKLPIAPNAVKLRGDPIFALECRATELRALCCDAPPDRRADQEFTRKFIRV